MHRCRIRDDQRADRAIVVEGEASTKVDEVRRPHRCVIAQLPERQRFVLERRYGLNDRGVQTLAEIAEELGLTRERVRQVRARRSNVCVLFGRADDYALEQEHRDRFAAFADQHVERSRRCRIVHRFQADAASEELGHHALRRKVHGAFAGTEKHDFGLQLEDLSIADLSSVLESA